MGNGCLRVATALGRGSRTPAGPGAVASLAAPVDPGERARALSVVDVCRHRPLDVVRFSVRSRKRGHDGELRAYYKHRFRCSACRDFVERSDVALAFDCERVEVEDSPYGSPVVRHEPDLHLICVYCSQWWNCPHSCPLCYAYGCPSCSYPHTRPCHFDCECHGRICGGLGCWLRDGVRFPPPRDDADDTTA